MPTDRTTAALCLALLLCVSANGDSTAQSLLDCQPRQVEPGQNVTCTIYVRDTLQEPTTIFNVGDFYISPIASVAGTQFTVSQVAVGADPTTVVFTMTAATGTNIAVNAYLRSTGEIVRGSGLVVVVLVWPATRIGTVSCATDSFVNGALPLRATTTCTAPVAGNTGLPAVVHPSDVYFTEDHFAGQFTFISGSINLIFNFTAATTLSSTFTNFNIRVTLASSAAVYSVSIPMGYPLIAPQAVSALQCNGQSNTVCFISAMDNFGPVAFVPASFNVVFERMDAVNGAWVTSTNTLNVSMTPSTTANVEQISWTLLVNNLISTQRIRVFVGPLEVSGSPFVFTSGVVPTSAFVSLRGCQTQYIPAGNSTNCTIDLLNGVTGDSRYFNIITSRGGVVSTPLYGTDPVTLTPVMTFTYTAPTVGIRTEDGINVVVATQAALNSPFVAIVFPITISLPVTSQQSSVPKIVAIGMLFYGSALFVGAYLFFKRQGRIRRVRQAKLEVAYHQLKTADVASHHSYTTAQCAMPALTVPRSDAPPVVAAAAAPATVEVPVVDALVLPKGREESDSDS